MSIRNVLVLALVAGCSGKSDDDGTTDSAPADADTDADSDADSDADADADSDADSDTDTDTEPSADGDGDGWDVDQDCDDADPAVLGLVTVDGAPFGDLAAALAAAVDGSAVSVCQGTHDGPFVATVPVHLASRDGRDLTILTGGGDRVLAVPGGSTVTGFTLRDGVVAGGDGGGLLLTTVGTLTVDDSILEDNAAVRGGGLAVPAGADVTVTGTVIRQNRASAGAGLLVLDGATVNLVETEISGNTAAAYGGGVRIEGGTLVGGTIGQNEADANAMYAGPYLGGGGISATGDVHIDGSVVRQNVASAGGGLEATDGTLTLTNVDVDANLNLGAFGDGAGVRCLRCDLVLEGTTSIHGNGGVASMGGGIHVSDGTVTGGLVTENSAGDGAGIFAVNATLTDVDIIANVSQSISGGIALFGLSDTIVGCDIVGNTTTQFGGAGEIGALDVTMTDSTVSGNGAGQSGGGFYIYGDHVRFERVVFEDNQGQFGGGALWISSPFSVVEVVDSSLFRNNAEWGGGAWLTNGARMSSEGSDWGTDADDNVPHDVFITEDDSGYGGGAPVGIDQSGYGAGATFACDDVSCTPAP